MNIAALVRDIKAVYSRTNTSFEEYLPRRLSKEINEICRGKDFWFMDVLPDTSFRRNFPISTLSTLPSEENNLARGWFKTEANEFEYSLMYPVAQTDAGVTSIKYWVTYSLNRILFLHRFELDGSKLEDIEIVSPEVFQSQMDYTSTGTPAIATVIDKNIHLYPTPDDEYLYSVSFRLLEMPELTAPNSTNDFMSYYEVLATKLGMMIAAEYFKDHEAYDRLKMEIFGNPAMPGSERLSLIGQVHNDSSVKYQAKERSMGFYSSLDSALNKNSSLRHENYHTYYPPRLI